MLTIAIQAGGRSERIGIDKALIPLAGVPMIEYWCRRRRVDQHRRIVRFAQNGTFAF